MHSASAIEDPRSHASSGRSMLVAIGLALVALTLVAAFWAVCSEQVDKADTRRAVVQEQQTAFADCLQYTPASTIASCKVRNSLRAAIAAAPVSAMPGMPMAGAAAVPVSFNLR